jgi:cysteine-rich repeat protein
MYDDFAGLESRTRRSRMPMVALSITGHLAVLAGLYSAAIWRIEKLDLAATPLFLAAPVASSAPAEGPAPPTRPQPSRDKRHLRHTRDLTQVSSTAAPSSAPKTADPAEAIDPEAEAPQAGDGLDLVSRCAGGPGCRSELFADLAASVCGDRKIEPGEQCDDGNRVSRDGCSASCSIEQRRVVDNRVIEGYRIAGEPQVHPSEDVRQQMVLHNQNHVLGAVKMCLWQDGTVISLQTLRSTGYREYDQLLHSRMRTWRYRPYQLADGTAVTACTVVVFVYRLDIRKRRPMVR